MPQPHAIGRFGILRYGGGIVNDAVNRNIGNVVDKLGIEHLAGIGRLGEGIVVPDNASRFITDDDREIQLQNKVQRNVAQNRCQLFIIRTDISEAECGVKLQNDKLYDKVTDDHHAAHSQWIQRRKFHDDRIQNKEQDRQHRGHNHTVGEAVRLAALFVFQTGIIPFRP